MKKIILSLMALVATMSINAQLVKVYKNGTLQETYTNTATDKYKVVFEEAPAPAADPNLLSGKFTVNADGKTVQFTKSNLYWDGNDYKFEANQYDYQTSWDANHVSHFFWSSTASVAYAQSYSDGSASTSDKFFCGEDNKITVEGTSGLFALSSDEWSYLTSSRTDATNLRKYGQTVGGKTNCLLIAPDGFDTSKWHSSNSYTLEEVNSLGLVCLPAAGTRNGSSFSLGGSYGGYWSSTPYSNGSGYAGCLYFYSGNVNTRSTYRSYGQSLRLVALPQ